MPVSRPFRPLATLLCGLLAGCSGFGFIGFGSTPTISEQPARVFYLAAPPSATASEPFVVKAWVVLEQSTGAHEELKPDSFRATVIPDIRQITIGGLVRVVRSSASAPASSVKATATVVDVAVSAPAGAYALTMANFPSTVPTSLYFSGYPWSPGGVQVKDVPRPQPGGTIIVHPPPSRTTSSSFAQPAITGLHP